MQNAPRILIPFWPPYGKRHAKRPAHERQFIDLEMFSMDGKGWGRKEELSLQILSTVPERREWTGSLSWKRNDQQVMLPVLPGKCWPWPNVSCSSSKFLKVFSLNNVGSMLPVLVYRLSRFHRVKNPPASAGDAGSVPGWGRSHGGGNDNLLQYSCLGNPMEPGRLQSMGSQRVRHNWGTKPQHPTTKAIAKR